MLVIKISNKRKDDKVERGHIRRKRSYNLMDILITFAYIIVTSTSDKDEKSKCSSYYQTSCVEL